MNTCGSIGGGGCGGGGVNILPWQTRWVVIRHSILATILALHPLDMAVLVFQVFPKLSWEEGIYLLWDN